MKKREKTPEEIMLEKLKLEIADSLGYGEKIKKYGWSALTASESGKIGGIIGKMKKGVNLNE